MSETDALKPTERARILNQANLIVAGDIEIRGFGRKTLRLEPQNWYTYDDKVLALMVNRHDFVIPLCQGYLLTSDSRYAEKLRDLFLYWAESFDVRNLKVHDTPIDAAIRLLNWLWALNSNVLDLTPESEDQITKAIYLQLEYISAWASSGGNHLVLEALAAYVYGALLRSSRRGKRWYRWGHKILTQEVRRQVSADGFHSEQSTFYHQAVTTHFLKAYLTAVRQGLPLADELSDPLRRMIRVVHDTMKPDLLHPMLGDGEPMTTDDREHWEAKLLIAAGTEIFGDPLFRPHGRTLNDTSLWFLGKSSSSFTTSDAAPESRIFAESGIALLRNANRYLLLDAAPFGDPHFPHHGHSDALSVEICMSGKSLIIDPGGYGYYDDEFRRYFRSTRAHNTLRVDERDQSETFGILGYGKLAEVSLENWSFEGPLEKVSASHRGYEPLLHRREIYHHQIAGFFLIVDWLLGSGQHRVESFYHLDPEIDLDIDSRTFFTGDHRYPWAVAASTPTSLTHLKSSDTAEVQGWYTETTGSCVPISVLQISADIEPPFFLATGFFEEAESANLVCEHNRVEIRAKNHSLALSMNLNAGCSTVES